MRLRLHGKPVNWPATVPPFLIFSKWLTGGSLRHTENGTPIIHARETGLRAFRLCNLGDSLVVSFDIF
jgi:hypothetical protein